MRPIYGCPENFRESLSTPTATFAEIWAFVPIDPMNERTKFEVRSFTHSWYNRGYSKNLGSPWIRPRYLFSQIFHGLLFGWTLNVLATFPVRIALPVPEIIAIADLGWGCEPQSWGRAGRRRSGMIPFERALVTSYRLSIVTFPLSLRVSEILPLLCSSTPLFSIPPLVSPKFPNVPLGIGGWPLGYEEQRGWAIMWSWSTNVTVRQTDDMQS